MYKNKNYVQMKQSLITDFWKFTLSPDPEKYKAGVGKKLLTIFRLWAFTIVFVLAAGILSTSLMDMAGWGGENAIEETLDESFWLVLVLAGVAAPIYEEILFRGWLGRTGKWLTSFLLVFTTYFFLDSFLPIFDTIQSFISTRLESVISIDLSTTDIDGSEISTADAFSALGAMVAAAIGLTLTSVILALAFSNTMGEWGKKANTTHYRWAVWVSTILFGLIHIFNNSDLGQVWYLIPLIALPQTIGGIELAWVRTRFGLVWAIISHAINNLLLVGTAAIVVILPEGVDETNFDYSSLTGGQLGGVAVYAMCVLLVLVGVLAANIYNIIEWSRGRKTEKAS